MIAAAPAFAAAPEMSCDAAAARAERDWNLPPGILSAVGTVESGRSSRVGVAPWPWTINAAGRGYQHESKAEAVATVLAIMQSGFPYIDVGCFQVDIAYHPGLFRSLDDAFDPDRNAQAAARILTVNRINAPDWNTAVARYHSATPERGGPYLERVRRALPAAIQRGLFAQAQGGLAASDPAPLSVTVSATEDAAETKRALPVVIYGYPIPASGHAGRAPPGRTLRE